MSACRQCRQILPRPISITPGYRAITKGYSEIRQGYCVVRPHIKKKLLTARSLFYRVSLGLLSQFAVRTQHVHNLVDVQLLHVLTSGLQILARIEVIGMLSQMLTNGSGHSQTRV